MGFFFFLATAERHAGRCAGDVCTLPHLFSIGGETPTDSILNTTPVKEERKHDFIMNHHPNLLRISSIDLRLLKIPGVRSGQVGSG